MSLSFTNDHAVAFSSLGLNRYLSALKYSTMVIGNPQAVSLKHLALAFLPSISVIANGVEYGRQV